MYDLAEAANETYDEDAGLDPTLMGDDDFAGPQKALTSIVTSGRIPLFLKVFEVSEVTPGGYGTRPHAPG